MTEPMHAEYAEPAGETTGGLRVDIAIIGGGIGGAAAAVALRQAGFDAHIFEREPVLEEIGGAVVVRQPSMDLFTKWGVEEAFLRGAVPVTGVQIRDGKTGEVRGETALAMDGSGAAWSAHRASVHTALLSALPDDAVHLGAAVTAVHDDENGATADLEGGGQVAARLIVGADGIRSLTRKLLSDDEPIFSHLVVIRTTINADVLPPEFPNDTIRMWGNEQLALLNLPMDGGATVALNTVTQSDTAPERLWDNEVSVDELASRFADFYPLVPELIATSSLAVNEHAVFDREPLKTWTLGHVTLLGDAAHPMAPRMGQGANSAIEDAGALASALATHGLDSVPAALADYEKIRVPAATAMQLGSRQAPPVMPGGPARMPD